MQPVSNKDETLYLPASVDTGHRPSTTTSNAAVSQALQPTPLTATTAAEQRVSPQRYNFSYKIALMLNLSLWRTQFSRRLYILKQRSSVEYTADKSPDYNANDSSRCDNTQAIAMSMVSVGLLPFYLPRCVT